MKRELTALITILALACAAFAPAAFAADAVMYSAPVDRIPYTAAGDVAKGEIVPLPDGRVGVATAAIDYSENPDGRVFTEGVFTVLKDTGIVLTAGDQIWWDTTDDTATLASLGDGAYYVGIATTGALTGGTSVRVLLNAAPPGPLQGVYVFDCETGVDAAAHILIPASCNTKGLLVTGVYAIVTEVFAGTEDQGVVTVEDTAGTDIITCTVADAGADAVGDVRLGYKIDSATAGDAAKTVAAGLGIRGIVTTPTTGAAAGKMKVYVTTVPLN